MTGVEIREESESDAAMVRSVVSAAFRQKYEAPFVERLRGLPGVFSFVAVDVESVVGHIMFSPIQGQDPSGRFHGVGLSPLSVRPDRQGQGIGSALVEHGLKACIARNLGLVVVLGNPLYYQRFGFKSAATIGLKCRWSVPSGMFMYLELKRGHAALAGGSVRFPAISRKAEIRSSVTTTNDHSKCLATGNRLA